MELLSLVPLFSSVARRSPHPRLVDCITGDSELYELILADYHMPLLEPIDREEWAAFMPRYYFTNLHLPTLLTLLERSKANYRVETSEGYLVLERSEGILSFPA